MDFSFALEWLSGAVAVLGLVQYLKGLAKKLPSWTWGVISIVLCVAWGFTSEKFHLAWGTLSITQLGYETLYQPILAKIRGAPKEGA